MSGLACIGVCASGSAIPKSVCPGNGLERFALNLEGNLVIASRANKVQQVGNVQVDRILVAPNEDLRVRRRLMRLSQEIQQLLITTHFLLIKEIMAILID